MVYLFFFLEKESFWWVIFGVRYIYTLLAKMSFEWILSSVLDRQIWNNKILSQCLVLDRQCKILSSFPCLPLALVTLTQVLSHEQSRFPLHTGEKGNENWNRHLRAGYKDFMRSSVTHCSCFHFSIYSKNKKKYCCFVFSHLLYKDGRRTISRQ